MEDVSTIRTARAQEVEQALVQQSLPGQNMTQGRTGQIMTQSRPGQNMTKGRTGQNMTQGRTGHNMTQGRIGQNITQGQLKTRTNLRMESSNHRQNRTNLSPDNQTLSRRCGKGVVTCIKCVGVIFLFLYFIIVPCIMIYFGVSSLHCEDLFPIWLIIGGVLCYITLIIFVIYMCMAMRKAACTGISFYVFSGFSFLLCIWWVSGFTRLAGSARYADIEKKAEEVKGIFGEPWVSDPLCKQYLLDFPFWLTISPLILFGLLGILGTIVCCFK